MVEKTFGRVLIMSKTKETKLVLVETNQERSCYGTPFPVTSCHLFLSLVTAYLRLNSLA